MINPAVINPVFSLTMAATNHVSPDQNNFVADTMPNVSNGNESINQTDLNPDHKEYQPAIPLHQGNMNQAPIDSHQIPNQYGTVYPPPNQQHDHYQSRNTHYSHQQQHYPQQQYNPYGNDPYYSASNTQHAPPQYQSAMQQLPMSQYNNNYPSSPYYQTTRSYSDPYGQYPSPPIGEEEEDYVATKVTAWIAVGSVLGLTAAAAFRWLNGGDFALFPPALINHQKKRQLQDQNNTLLNSSQQDRQEHVVQRIDQASQRQTALDHSHLVLNHNNQQIRDELSYIEEEIAEYDDDDYDEYDGTKDLDQQSGERLQKLEHHVNKLVETVQSSGDRQERLLKRLLAEKDREITDQAIGFLKSQKQQNESDSCDQKENGVASLHSQINDTMKDLSLLREDMMKFHENEIGNIAVADKAVPSRIVSDAIVNWDTKLNNVCQKFEELGLSLQSTIGPTTQISTDQLSSESYALRIETLQASDTVSVDSDSKVLSQNQFNSCTTSNTVDDNHSSISTVTRVIEAFTTLLLENDDITKLKAATQLLYLYVWNLSNHPTIPRYRKIHTTNDTYKKQIEPLNGARELLLAVGFIPSESNTNFIGSRVVPNQTKSNMLEWSPTVLIQSSMSSDDSFTQNEIEESFVDLLKKVASSLKVLNEARSNDYIADARNNLLQRALITSELSSSPSTRGFITPAKEESISVFTRHNVAESVNGTNLMLSKMNTEITDNVYPENTMSLLPPKTPEPGSMILSPPIPKKHPLLVASADFPELPAMSNVISKPTDTVVDIKTVTSRDPELLLNKEMDDSFSSSPLKVKMNQNDDEKMEKKELMTTSNPFFETEIQMENEINNTHDDITNALWK